jgi:hypothetical protein
MVIAIIGLTTTGQCLDKQVVGYVSYDFDAKTAIKKLEAAQDERRKLNPEIPLTVYQAEPLVKLV